MDLFQQLLTAPFEFFKNYGGPFILVLSLLVFVHEFGHYIVARWCGVRVDVFSIGFGRELFGRTDRNGTRWKFSLIPLGGYVQMFGDLDPASARSADAVTAEEEGERPRPMTPEERKVAFFTQPVGKRAAIVAAGPAINFLFAIVLLTGLYTIEGKPYTPPVAGAIVEDSAAARAGMQPDDKIVSLNGEKVERFQDLTKFVAVNLDREIDVQVVRYKGEGVWDEANPVNLKVTPALVVEEDRFGFRHSTGRMGIKSPPADMAMQEHSLPTALGAAVADTWEISVNTLTALGQMIIGYRSVDELGGILRIGAYAGEYAQRGLIAMITFAALLSVNLGLINLLPIPMLDGGHLTFYALESIKGRPVGERVQEYALRLGMIFLFGIMVFATWNDLLQLKVVDYVLNLVS
jgi:regulator of sigma E protease